MNDSQEENQPRRWLTNDEIDSMWITRLADAPHAVVRGYYGKVMSIYRMVFYYGVPATARVNQLAPLDLITAMGHIVRLEKIIQDRNIDTVSAYTEEEEKEYLAYYDEFLGEVSPPEREEPPRQESVSTEEYLQAVDSVAGAAGQTFKKIMAEALTNTKLDA